MKIFLKYFIIGFSIFVVLSLISCDITLTLGNKESVNTTAEAAPGNTETPVGTKDPETQNQPQKVNWTVFDIPESYLAYVKEGESILKVFIAAPMKDIGEGELNGNRIDMSDVINNSVQCYVVYDNKLKTKYSQVTENGYVPRNFQDCLRDEIPLFLNFIDTYIDIFASTKATKDLEQVELLDVYFIYAEDSDFSRREGFYIYTITNYREYIFFKQHIDDEHNTYLFPAQFVYTLTPKILDEASKLVNPTPESEGAPVGGVADVDMEAVFDMSEYIVGGAEKEE